MNSQNSVETKAAVSVSEMARMVGLSRQRFGQLQGTTFPWPLYDVVTRRPFYPEDLQKVCLEVRRRHWGIDGRPVLFYAPRQTSRPRTAKPVKDNQQHAVILDGVKALGQTNVTAAQVAEAVSELFPQGTSSEDEAKVIGDVFVHLRRKNSRVNVASK